MRGHARTRFRLVEIFESIQGEGAQAGRRATFVRFSKCSAACAWCDTPYEQVNEELSFANLVARCVDLNPRFVIFTGGEPALQLTPSLLRAFKSMGFETAIETNGAHDLTELGLAKFLDWICVSPKLHVPGGTKRWVQLTGHEIKVVWDRGFDPSWLIRYGTGAFERYYVSPEWEARDVTMPAVTAYCLRSPVWRVSLQTHKILGVR